MKAVLVVVVALLVVQPVQAAPGEVVVAGFWGKVGDGLASVSKKATQGIVDAWNWGVDVAQDASVATTTFLAGSGSGGGGGSGGGDDPAPPAVEDPVNNPPPPPPPAEPVCPPGTFHRHYNGVTCWNSKQDYDYTVCIDQGNVWDNGTCKNQETLLREQCVQSGGYYQKYGLYHPCWASSHDFQQVRCSYRSDGAETGNTWYDGRCMSVEAAQKLICSDQGLIFWEQSGGCVTQADLKLYCENSGSLWVAAERMCYVAIHAHIPRGLEAAFKVVASAQEKAMLGEYRDSINNRLQGQDEELRTLLDGMAEAVDLLFQFDLEAAYAEIEADLEGFDDNLEARSRYYQQALKETEEDYREVQRVREFLEGRLEMQEYGGHAPEGSVDSVLRLAGFGAKKGDVTVSFPKGFPTPRDGGDAWYVSVPVRVHLPALEVPMGGMEFHVSSVAYAFSTTGGDIVAFKEVGFDSVGGGDAASSVTVDFLASIPKSSGNMELVLEAGVTYTEEYEFDMGVPFSLEGYREAHQLKRTFYTSSNPFAASTSSSSPTIYDEGQEHENETGSSPGGGASAMNWYEEQMSVVGSKAEEWDDETGFGFRLLVGYWPYILMAGAILVLAWRLGWLDKIRERFRGKDLNDDLLGGDLGDLGGRL